MDYPRSTMLRNDTTTTQAPTRSRGKLLTSFSGWWWEFGAVLIGITSIAMIIVFLSQIEGTPLNEWTYQIQPNTVISILTTTGKSTMMIAIASCLGQFKWARVQRPTKLRDLQVIDDASRGPWGALMVFFNLDFWGATLAYCLGVVTILALAFEPTTQQILNYPTREAQMHNATALLGATNRTYELGNATSQDFIRMDGAILNAALGKPHESLFHCPETATKCAWSTFTTLAICRETQHFISPSEHFDSNSDEIGVTCGNITTTVGSRYSCNYTILSDASELGYQPLTLTDFGESALRAGSIFWMSHLDNGFAFRLAAGHPDISPSGIWSDVKLSLATWKWCTKTFHNPTATPLGLLNSTSITEDDVIEVSDGNENYRLRSSSTGIEYQGFTGDLFQLLQERIAFVDNLDINLARWGIVQPENFTADVDKFATNLADTLNGVITSHYLLHNPSLQTVQGSVFFDEVYIEVRWAWLILPIVEMALAAIFLVVTVILNRDQPIFKNSILPYLAHGLDGWRSGELYVQPPESTEGLEKVLFKETATLSRGEDGQLKLRKFEEVENIQVMETKYTSDEARRLSPNDV